MNDKICVNYTTTTSVTSATKYTTNCWYQDFLGINYYAEKINGASGTLGLGFGSPAIGNSFLYNFNASTKGAVQMQWSLSSGPWYTNTT